MLLFLCSLFHINGKICYCIIWIRVALERCSSESTGTMCFVIEVILCLWDIIWIKFGFIFCACRHLEKQNELLTEIHRSMSHELHKLQVIFFFFGNILLTLSGLKKSSEKLVIVNSHVVTELLSYGAVIFMQLVFIYSFSWNIMFYDDLQVEEEMLMRKFYELMTAHGLTKKVCLHCVERLGTNLSLVSFLNYFLISRPGGFACSLLDLS